MGRTTPALEMQYPVWPLQIHSEVNLDMAFHIQQRGGLAWKGGVCGVPTRPPSSRLNCLSWEAASESQILAFNVISLKKMIPF